MVALVVVLLAVFTHESISLEVKDFSVPAVVIKGDPVWLNCSYDRESYNQYRIRWYKNDVEFYRYLPSDVAIIQKYAVPGIFLDADCCNEGSIFMYKTDTSSEGTYTCEVSNEDFRIYRGEGEMKIYVYPSSPPEIVGVKNRYALGEIVNATCISSASRPRAILRWRINGHLARIEDLHQLEPRRSSDGLFTSELILNFQAKYDHFRRRRMKLVCEAIIPQAHTLRSEEIVVSNHWNPSERTYYTLFNFDPHSPSIHGISGGYDEGNMADINCTSVTSPYPSELRWYINDRKANPEYLTSLESMIHNYGVMSTSSSLKFMIKDGHFRSNKMRLRCTATNYEVTKMYSEALEAEISAQQTSDPQKDLNMGGLTF